MRPLCIPAIYSHVTPLRGSHARASARAAEYQKHTSRNACDLSAVRKREFIAAVKSRRKGKNKGEKPHARARARVHRSLGRGGSDEGSTRPLIKNFHADNVPRDGRAAFGNAENTFARRRRYYSNARRVSRFRRESSGGCARQEICRTIFLCVATTVCMCVCMHARRVGMFSPFFFGGVPLYTRNFGGNAIFASSLPVYDRRSAETRGKGEEEGSIIGVCAAEAVCNKLELELSEWG